MNDTRPVALESAVRTKGLTKRYGEVLAVDGLELEIAAGQFFGLLGPNGSGKTTTIHMLSTLVRPSAGSAIVAGHDVGKAPVAVRREIGLVFQESALDRTLTIAQSAVSFTIRAFCSSTSRPSDSIFPTGVASGASSSNCARAPA
jgi:ABC-type multidrug transport system ATPase subunit